MSDELGTFGIAITADNKVERGAKEAEKRLAKVGTRVSDVNRRAMVDAERTTLRSSKSIIGNLGKVEQATARALGGRSLTSGLAARLGAVGEAGSAMAGGLGEAATAGGALAATAGAVTMAVGATVAVVAAAAYAAFKLADGWAKGAAQIGRMAEIIGVGTKQLQEFNAAAERVGVDKSTASGTLGSMSQTLNDARYGRNVQALEVLRRLGVKMVTNADGTVNVGAMLPQIADALKRQNSSGRRTAARYLGIPEAALPVFTQGGKALAEDMADADQHAAILSDDDIAMAQRIARKGVRVGQLKDRLLSKAGRATANKLEPGYDLVLEGGQRFSEAVDDGFRPAVREFKGAVQSVKDRVGGAIDAARSSIAGTRAGRILSLSAQEVVDLKKVVATEWGNRSKDELHGIVDTVLNRKASGHWGGSIASVANAYKQFSDINGPVSWKRGRRSVAQVSMSRVSRKASQLVDEWLAARAAGAPSSVGDNLNYANLAASDAKNRPWIRKLPIERGAHRHGTVPELQQYRPGEFQIALPDVKISVEVNQRGRVTGTTVTNAKGAISHAIPNGNG